MPSFTKLYLCDKKQFSTLQQAGMIRYTRGKITILDRENLESIACECYGVIKNEFARLLDTESG